MSGDVDLRTYQRADCAVFRKTAEEFGGLSNMASGFPVRINSTRILTVEALYQACRFPHRPEVQRKIIEQASPMTAKMVGKPYRDDSRVDWDRVRVKIMRWVLRLKLAIHWTKFSELLLSTGDCPIVEDSRRDNFWGAIPVSDSTLVGMNVLGRLLMELREEIKHGTELRCVIPPIISDFLLLGEAIGIIDSQINREQTYPLEAPNIVSSIGRTTLPLFEESAFEPPDIQTSPLTQALPDKSQVFMLQGLQPYSDYKDLGLLWLGEVPAHWTVRRIKYIVQEVNSRSTTGDEQLLRISQFTGVTQRLRLDGQVEQNTRAASLVGYKLVQPDDLVINIMLAWNGSMGVSHFSGIASPAYCVYRFQKGALPWYFHHLFRSPAYKARIKAMSTGVVESRLRLYSNDLFRMESLLPPPEEQAAIVKFLDWANTRLERTIRAKRQVIALLTEQKQAIIHRAVTRGLDPNVPLKPSGIAWLGDIPAHWEVWRIGRFAKVGNGSTPSRSDSSYWNGGTYPWLNSSQVNRGLIDSSDQFVTPVALRECHLPKVPAGSILVAITGQGKTRGTSAVLAMEATINQHLAYITNRPIIILSDFLHLALIAAYATLRALSDDSGSTKGALTCEDLKRFKLPVPPVSEQACLIKAIALETSTTDTAISRLNREIYLLREYRTRLVADVVTGKLDVREAAARLPQDKLAAELAPEALDPDEATDTEAELEE